MEQWQFLIQKEGERTWHPLSKPGIEIIEGRYRVVARSKRTNTDVEVRVTHSDPNELPPKRRIQKRRRRTNSEGLTAIIPFTYLKSGIWELQCSGDLMSDLLGASWQYTVNLQVIPSGVNSARNLDKQHKNGEGIQLKQTKSKIKIQSSRYSPSPLQELTTNDAGLFSSISVEPISSKSRNTNSSKQISIRSNSAPKADLDKVVSEKPAQKLRESLKAASDKQKAVTKTAQSTQNKIVSDTSEKRQNSAKTASVVKPAQKPKSSQHQAVSASSVPKTPQKSSTKQNQNVSQDTPKPQEKSLDTSNLTVSEKLTKNENLAIIEQTASPVRVKGETAEQILQNLIELALPNAEPLLADETIEDTSTTPPLPLQLTLDRVNHVASWGESITLDGLVELKETTNVKQISQAEVRIELRSPQNSELLQSVCQPNPNKSLPFAIASSIDIPQKCASKLILGEVKLYGALSSNGVVELLASQSFIITADIKELVAITVANPKYEKELSLENTPEIIEPAVSLDLELFNLVKTVKPEKSVPGIASNKKSLPPRIEPRKFRRKVTSHSLKLPNVPGYQEKINEYINNGYIVSGCAIGGTSFPYLRKLKPLPSSDIEAESDYEVEATYTSVADNQNLDPSSAADNTSQAELVVEHHNDTYEELGEPVTPRSSEFIVEKNPGTSNTSPLIRQWMLSQGYSLPEPIDVEYEDYDIEANHQEISQQADKTKAETDDKQLLNQEKGQVSTNVTNSVNIQTTPSPYLSISTSSAWDINQITTPSTQLAQEIVVDDTDIFTDDILTAEDSESNQPIEKAIDSSCTALTISTQKIEHLPTPQLYIPRGELVAGKSLNLRVRLPEGNSHLAIKLWLEDCQTRILLDGPHLLTNLTPNNNNELEVITKLNIPFGCIEIRLEAIAINTVTQQESHKFTIQRTVIPPDLPNIQFDAILGM
ncbi:MAG: hypothetical protein WBA41_00900 [Rivularia sp. (in: cyanobacteria)]